MFSFVGPHVLYCRNVIVLEGEYKQCVWRVLQHLPHPVISSAIAGGYRIVPIR